MPSVSKIPQNINKYAIECGYKIRNMPLEHAKGINFDMNKITSQSDLITGNWNSVNYPFHNLPKDIIIHSHPENFTFSCEDILTAIRCGVKKMFAFDKDGYFAMDFTTVKKNISKTDQLCFILNADEQSDFLMDQRKKAIPRKHASTKNKKMTVSKLMKIISLKNQWEETYKNNIKEFAKFSGATFSDVKWNDYEKVKRGKNAKCQ